MTYAPTLRVVAVHHRLPGLRGRVLRVEGDLECEGLAGVDDGGQARGRQGELRRRHRAGEDRERPGSGVSDLGPSRERLAPLQSDVVGKTSDTEEARVRVSLPKMFQIVLTLGALLLVQCKGAGAKPSSSPEPQGTLENYFAAVERGDAEGWWKLMCAADQAARPLEEVQNVRVEGPSAKHVVKSIKVDGASALATVAVTGPEPGAVLNELFKIAKEGKKPSEKDFERIAKDGSIPKVTRDQEFRLVRETAGWRVDMGFAALKDLMALSEQARALEDAGRIDEAEKVRGEIDKKRATRFGSVNPEVQRSLDESMRKNLALDELEPALKNVSDSMDRLKESNEKLRQNPR